MSPFAIAAAQSSSTKGDIAGNLRRHARLVALAKEHGADAVVFPELSLTGYEPTIAAQTAMLAYWLAFVGIASAAAWILVGFVSYALPLSHALDTARGAREYLEWRADNQSPKGTAENAGPGMTGQQT